MPATHRPRLRRPDPSARHVLRDARELLVRPAKAEAIAFAWEFVTETLGMPRSRLYASVFAGEGNLPRDEDAIALWKKIGLPADHIVSLGRADNFWGPAGGSGPCGPCSEIYFDLGERRPDYLAEGAFWGERPGDAGDRYMEFWNLVFPQFDAQADGSLKPLPRPGIDTGMGIERLALIVQGKSTIFETDLFAPLVDSVLDLARPPAERRAAALRDARIIADHTRALVFAIAEGALPGNEGAGYVLRRLLRRAVTRGRSRRGLALHRPFLAATAERAIAQFAGHYRELGARRSEILRVMEQEEAGFTQTFEAGLARLEKLLKDAREVGGEDAFALHDTYGFPIELLEEIARESGVAVDRAGFERAMEEQRARARAASKFTQEEGAASKAWTIVTLGADSEFLGYRTLAAEGLTLRRWREHAASGRGPNAAPEIELVLDRTPCYAESGGQVADRGAIEGGGARAELVHVYKEGESIVHRARLVSGTCEALVEAGRTGVLAARVDPAHRAPTMRHHTATHLLHAALRKELGSHVRQAGSLVAPDRLRFDYTHFEAPSHEKLAAIEDLVNEWVLRNPEVKWEILPLQRAKEMGAMALFGEKYGAEVRMVTVPGVDEAGIPTSRELCGGTHVARTGDIGAFVLVADGAIASGVRRIEALCGHEALRWLKAQGETLARAAHALQSSPAAVPEQVEKLKTELTSLRKAQAEQRRGGLADEMARLAIGAEKGAGGRWVVAAIESEAETEAVREAADKLRGALGRGAAVLAIRSGGKLAFLAAVTDDLVAEKKLRADELVRAVAKVAGGSGGGKPHLALAGAKDPAKLEDALAEARRIIQGTLGVPA
ncbi:MAG: alanine--tRNA ligase [Candidatus Eisenbacteria bacterium]|uniref:Alanine--tRNA ligase n=1 Tax=Eiseniibacteriota bacterium TaxID=2212470 RepID=A0A538T790_UNCEI|nr:MAG: alanine--tRNA ligase [Candidatus Eisenbacteria bacterium]